MKLIEEIVNDIRIKLVLIHQNSPHLASSLSALEIITILYYKTMNIINFEDPNRDRFILSKGHAVSALYSVLQSKGFLEYNLDNYPRNGGKLFSHPVRNYIKGVEVSSGSLGHGLSIGIGIAYSAKIDGRNFMTYVLMGDGECQEGSVWEAAILGARLKLDNLVALIDANGLQDSDYVDNIQPNETLYKKWKAFGWNVKVCNGNVINELDLIIKNNFVENKPLVVIIKTTKGKGIKEIENKLFAHHYIVPKEKVNYLVKELKNR